MKNISGLTAQEQGALEAFLSKSAAICGERLRSVRLFGSRARGQGDEESDLDLLVLSEGIDQKIKVRLWDAAYEVFTATGIFLSPWVLSPDQYERLKNRERLIALDIEREGIPL